EGSKRRGQKQKAANLEGSSSTTVTVTATATQKKGTQAKQRGKRNREPTSSIVVGSLRGNKRQTLNDSSKRCRRGTQVPSSSGTLGAASTTIGPVISLL